MRVCQRLQEATAASAREGSKVVAMCDGAHWSVVVVVVVAALCVVYIVLEDSLLMLLLLFLSILFYDFIVFFLFVLMQPPPLPYIGLYYTRASPFYCYRVNRTP